MAHYSGGDRYAVCGRAQHQMQGPKRTPMVDCYLCTQQAQDPSSQHNQFFTEPAETISELETLIIPEIPRRLKVRDPGLAA